MLKGLVNLGQRRVIPETQFFEANLHSRSLDDEDTDDYMDSSAGE